MSAPAEESRWFDEASLDRGRWGILAEPAIEAAAAAERRDRLPHAILVAGPAGLGRELAGVEIAAVLTCPEEAGPWCECRSCTRVRRGVHPDVAALLPSGPAARIKIEQVREIVTAAPGRPFESRRRIWIVDGAEAGRLGGEAANAFLKTLEEPPAHVAFLLLAANPEAVLPTISSRCHRLALPGPAAAARRLGEPLALPELAATEISGDDPEPAVEAVRDALRAALERRLESLLRLPYLLPATPSALELVAAVAIDLAGGAEEASAEALVRLASELLVVERRCRALNLSRRRQLLSTLLAWQREPLS